MANPLVEIVSTYLRQFMADLDTTITQYPCEVQLRGHMLALELDVTFGAALWNGSALTNVVAYNNAFLLTRDQPRTKKYYLYAVLRTRVPGQDFKGLRFTYVLPPEDVFECDVFDADSQDELLLLDADVKNYARGT
jgi:hypothetical protein